jgi:hypothetical protein
LMALAIQTGKLHCNMTSDGSSAQFYREEARRIRAIAEASSLSDMKEKLLKSAEQFERLAEHYEKGLCRCPPE